MPDLPSIRIPRRSRAQSGEPQRRRTLRDAEIGRSPFERIARKRKLVGQAELRADVCGEAGFQLLESQAAVPAGACLVEYIPTEDVGFRQAEVLIVPVPLVAAIAAAGAEQRKQIADVIIVEIADVAAIERILGAHAIIDARRQLVGGDFGRANRALE